LRKGKSALRQIERRESDESAKEVPKERPKSAKGKKRSTLAPAKYKTKPTARLRPLSGNKVVFTRGQLKVSVSYPTHTEVVLKRIGCEPKTIEKEYCCCAFKQV